MIKTLPVVGPGLYEMEAETYHRDPCPDPSLNHTIARILDRSSPHHAWKAHPRLGGQGVIPSREMTIGSAVHEWAIGKGGGVDRIAADSFRTNAAKAERDASLAAGRTPLLEADYDIAQAMWPHMRSAIEDVAGAGIFSLHREIVAIANDGEFWLRSMFDVMTPDLRLIIDAKTTATAEPGAFGSSIGKYYATGAAFYTQVLDLIDPAGVGKRRFVWIAQERDHPEAITYHELDADALAIADGKMKRARLQWAMCQSTNHWPAYDRGPHKVVPKQWELDEEFDAMEASAEAF